MSRSIAIAFLLLLPASTRADAPGPPGLRTIWVEYTFVVEESSSEYAFFLWSMAGESVMRLPLSPSSPVRIPVTDEFFRRYRASHIYAVRKELLVPFGDSTPPHNWFRGGWQLQYPEGVSYIDFRKSVWFTDNREQVEIMYRIEIGPNGGRLVKVAENVGNAWVRRGWIAAGILIPVSLVGFGVWWLRRSRRPTV